MKLFKLLLLSLFLFSSAVAQEEKKITADEALKSSSIQEQFDVIIKKSGNYQDYKVIKRLWIDKLKSNSLDSIKTLETSLKQSKSAIEQSKNKITELEKSLTKTNETLAAVNEDKESILFFGSNVSKSSYKLIMWSIIGLLVILLGLFIFKFKNSNTITVQAKQALADLEMEFEDHRRRALEREQKVMRKLQDEINKQRKTSKK